MPKSVSFPSSLCCNCDSEPARYICGSCKESDRYLCFNCSILHPKIKQFREHSVEAFNSSSSRDSASTNQFDIDKVRIKAKVFIFAIVKRIRTYVEHVYDVVGNRDSVDSTVYYQTITLAILAVVMGYSLLKVLFGSHAIIVVLIVFYGYYYVETLVNKEMKDILHKPGSEKVVSSPIVKNSSRGLYKVSQRQGFPDNPIVGVLPSYTESTLPSSSIQISNDSEEFKNEFWHDMECKPAKFRPRGRAYKVNRSSETSHDQQG